MGRNYLKGRAGDRINAVLAAAGYNLYGAVAVKRYEIPMFSSLPQSRR
jgi:hypothetical protein